MNATIILKILDKTFVVQGVKNATIDNVEKVYTSFEKISNNTVMLLADSKFVAGIRHIELLLCQHLKAESDGLLYARKSGFDLLARVSCQTQLNQVVTISGLKKGTMNLVIILNDVKLSNELKLKLSSIGTLDDRVIYLDNLKKQFLLKYHNLEQSVFKSTPEDENLFPLILAEKSALLAVE
jgi:tRNA threonylcarbamoyladenosine modification (KEOPS) complex Cgi121 subunit